MPSYQLALATPFTVAALVASVGVGVLSAFAAMPLHTARPLAALPKLSRN